MLNKYYVIKLDSKSIANNYRGRPFFSITKDGESLSLKFELHLRMLCIAFFVSCISCLYDSK